MGPSRHEEDGPVWVREKGTAGMHTDVTTRARETNHKASKHGFRHSHSLHSQRIYPQHGLPSKPAQPSPAQPSPPPSLPPSIKSSTAQPSHPRTDPPAPQSRMPHRRNPPLVCATPSIVHTTGSPNPPHTKKKKTGRAEDPGIVLKTTAKKRNPIVLKSTKKKK